MAEKPKVIVVGGPTATGKTGLAIRLARRFDAEIINSDSLQIYRYLDIGTAKPTAEELAAAPHHLIDIVDPDEEFDAARYLELARPLIEKFHQRKKPAIVVGGTGLYLRSLLHGLFPGPGKNEEVRTRIKAEAKEIGWEGLHRRLEKVDPETAKRLHPNDRVRIERALEVFESTGRPISEYQKEHGLRETPYNVLFFCLTLPREDLYERIDLRTRMMFDQGFVDEVKNVLAMGYSPDLKPLQSIGYKQVTEHLAGRLALDDAIRETATSTRRFAKRQFTWYKAQPEARWVSPTDHDDITEEAEKFLSDRSIRE